MAETCAHQNFAVKADVGRINKDGNGPIVAYICDLHVWCRDCDQQFEFFGLPNGMSFYRPTVSIDGKEAHFPLVIPGTQPPSGLAGFSVTHTVFDEDKAAVQ